MLRNMSLRELQKAFMASVYSRGNASNATSDIASGMTSDRSSDARGKVADALDYLDPKHALSRSEQMDIYRGSVQAGLQRALADIFPRTRVNLGAQFFDAMALEYLLQFPSQSPSLDDFGERLPEFCDEFKPLKDFPYVGDLAGLEWAWHLCFHGHDAQALNANSWLSANNDDLLECKLQVAQNVRSLRSDYPIFEIWKSSAPLSDIKDSKVINLESGGESVLIWRPELQVQVAKISDECLRMLALLSDDKTISEAIDALVQDGISNEAAAACFTQLLQWQVFDQ